MLPEPDGDDRRDASEKVALLSAHLDERIVAGLRNAFELGGMERSSLDSPTEEDDDDVDEQVRGLASKIASDTLIRSPRRKSRGSEM